MGFPPQAEVGSREGAVDLPPVEAWRGEAWPGEDDGFLEEPALEFY